MLTAQFLEKEMFAKGLIKIAQVVINFHHGAPRPHKNG